MRDTSVAVIREATEADWPHVRALFRGIAAAGTNAAVRAREACGFAVVGRLPGAFRQKELGPVDAVVMFRAL